MNIEVMKQDMLDEGTKIGFDKGVAQGISKGIFQEKSNIVLKMLTLKYHEDEIAEVTGLTLAEVQNIKNQPKVCPNK